MELSNLNLNNEYDATIIESPVNDKYYELCEENLPELKKALAEYTQALEAGKKVIIRSLKRN